MSERVVDEIERGRLLGWWWEVRLIAPHPWIRQEMVYGWALTRRGAERLVRRYRLEWA